MGLGDPGYGKTGVWQKKKGPRTGALFQFLLPVGRADYIIDADASELSRFRQPQKTSRAEGGYSTGIPRKKPRQAGRGQSDREEARPRRKRQLPRTSWILASVG